MNDERRTDRQAASRKGKAQTRSRQSIWIRSPAIWTIPVYTRRRSSTAWRQTDSSACCCPRNGRHRHRASWDMSSRPKPSSRSCPAIASIINNHALTAHGIAKWGSDKQKSHYLPALAKGEQLGAVAIYEAGSTPGIGSDALVASRRSGWIHADRHEDLRAECRRRQRLYRVRGARTGGRRGWLDRLRRRCHGSGSAGGSRSGNHGLEGVSSRASDVLGWLPVSEHALLGTVNGGSSIADHLLSLGAVAEAAQTSGSERRRRSMPRNMRSNGCSFTIRLRRCKRSRRCWPRVSTDSHLAWLGVQRAAQLIEGGAPFERERAMVKAFLAPRRLKVADRQLPS